jgi:hypothetical protein
MGLPRSLTLNCTKSCRSVFHGFEIYDQAFNISFDIYLFISNYNLMVTTAYMCQTSLYILVNPSCIFSRTKTVDKYFLHFEKIMVGWTNDVRGDYLLLNRQSQLSLQ